MNRIDPLHCKRLIHFLQKENTPLQNKYICPRCMCRKLIIESSKAEKYLFSININGSIVQNSKKNIVVFDVYDSGKVIKRLIIN